MTSCSSSSSASALSASAASSSMRYQSGWRQAYETHNQSSLWSESPIPVMSGILPILQDLQQAMTIDKQKMVVIDVGCGDGRNLLPLCQAGFEVIGMDLSARALERAHEKLLRMGYTSHRSSFVVGDCSQMPYLNQSIAAVTCFDVFGQLPEPAAFLQEVHRVLLPGGLFIVNAFDITDETYQDGEPIEKYTKSYKGTLFKYFEETDIRALVTNSGFSIVSCEKKSWKDPPHGEFRPKSHVHVNWVIVARKQQATTISSTPLTESASLSTTATATATGPQKELKSFETESVKHEKLTIVVNTKFSTGRLMNASAHLAAGMTQLLTSKSTTSLSSSSASLSVSSTHPMKFINYENGSGQVYPSISSLSFVILSAKSSKHLSDAWTNANAAGVQALAFLESMTGDTYVEQLERTKALTSQTVEFMALALFGDSELLRTLTKKFSLYKGPEIEAK